MEAKSVSLDACKHLVTPQVNCKMLKIIENCQDYQALRPPSLGQSHSATFETEPTAACEKSNLGAEGGANASVGTPGAIQRHGCHGCHGFSQSLPVLESRVVSLGCGAQSIVLQRGTQGAYAKQPRGPSIPSVRPCLDYGKWRATGSGPDAVSGLGMDSEKNTSL